jgi:alkylhydroperoxidase family enzyme
VSNAAYSVTDEAICTLHGIGLSDPEILDLALAASLFSALAVVEPLIMAPVLIPLR